MIVLDVGVLRALAVMVPVIASAVLWLIVDDVLRRAAAILALCWQLVALMGVNILAVQLDWWSFGSAGGAFFGVPVDVVIGWAVLWSVIPVPASATVPIGYLAALLVFVDLAVMPRMAPLVTLGRWWMVGELVALAVALLPGLLLAELMIRRRWLVVRVALQMVVFTAVLLVAIPALTYVASGQDWTLGSRFGEPGLAGALDAVVLQVAGVVALVGVASVIEFARAGGTPWPWDPPLRLVITGPYAYVRNPMQVCGVLLLLLMALVLGFAWLAVSAVLAALFSAGLASYVEKRSLSERFGSQWSDYCAEVGDWVPRRRPAPRAVPAIAYLARGCDPCSELAGWLTARRPTGLVLRDAEDFPKTLWRMRYEDAGAGISVDGVRAFGLCLTHLNLVWAVVGWVIATPGVSHALQLVVDASGGGPWAVRPSSSGR